jgi:hypothetical protein
MPHPDAVTPAKDQASPLAGAPARPGQEGGETASLHAWFPPKVDEFEITPEASMYAGRR